MPRIAILLPLVWSVRNVLHAGVLRALAQDGVEAHLLLRSSGMPPLASLLPEAERHLLADAHACHPLIEPVAGADGEPPRGKALLDELATSAFQQQRGSESYAIYRRWFTRDDRGLARARRRGIDVAGRLAASPRVVHALERRAERLVRRTRDLDPVRAQLRAIDPDLLWSTVNVSSLEQPYRLAARDLGLPVASSILSFDNLTSRGPLARDDHYLVWSDRMKAQLRRLYPEVEETRVSVTGTPQFDFHRQPACRWTRARMLRDLHLPSSASYFLYAASHVSLAPEEPALVAALAARMDRRALLANRALIVRLHPLDDAARWRAAIGGVERVRLTRAFATARITDGWIAAGSGPVSADDQARLVSALAHADACLNIASTMTLDAALQQRPVICLDFRGEPDAPRDILFAEYGAEHYAPLVASGGLRMAHGWSELLDLMEAAVVDPTRDREARARMVTDECGLVDGRAAARVARVLMHLAGAAARARRGDETMPERQTRLAPANAANAAAEVVR